ncbi:MAG: hypothetical protein WKG00_04165 [Polyangiaceae bacterium]
MYARSVRKAMWAVGLAVALLGALARAQPEATPPQAAAPSTGVERARALTERGRDLLTAGDVITALATFREAAQLAESPGLRFNIALAEEKLGQLVAALLDYRLAKRQAARGDAPQVSASVDARIAALEPRIAAFTIQRPAGAERATVFVDGVAAAHGGSRIAVDPGPHRVTALVDGVTRFERIVRVGEGESRAITLTLSPLPERPRPTAPGYVIGGVGLASLAVMGVFIGLRQGVLADLEKLCRDDGHCAAAAQEDIDRGRTYTGVAEVTAVVGTVALLGGAVLLWRAYSNGSDERRGAAAVVVRAGAGGLLASGVF